MSFFDYALSQMIEPDNLLVKVESIVNWSELSELLDKKLFVRDGKVVGKVPYNYLSLFKVLLTQQWHSLSDPKMEDALKTRIDFMWFTGFGLASKDFMVPDETTICRFRNKLVKRKLLDKLLKLSEIKELEKALGNVDTTEGIKVLYADKGYASNDNVELLKKKNIGNGIMDKVTRNKALTARQTKRNKRISKTRYIVERTNATLKNIFNLERAKYIGLAKVKSQTLLVSIAHNLLKAANKIKVSEIFYRKVVSKNCLNGLFA